MNGVSSLVVKQKINEWFTYFHAHPEISFQEVETTKKVSEILTEMAVRHHTFSDVTGVIAEIGEGNRVVAVRADMDALWQEVDGEFRANHSCGHDAHMSMVLGALAYLQDMELGCRVRFIFQPAEEKGNGSIEMVERGAVDDVSHLFGVHLRPIEEIPFGKVTPSIHHGAGIFLSGKIMGVDAHGARPHQGINALDPIFAIAHFLKTIYFSPFEPYSAKMTKVQAGGENVNIIPGTATFSIDVRAQSNLVLHDLQSQIDKGIRTIADMHKVQVELSWDDHTPAAEVSDKAVILATESIKEVVGEAGLSPAIITSGSDDFHFYTLHRPEIKATMIGIGADLAPGLHHPKMTFNQDALDIGAKILAKTLQKASLIEH